MKKAYTIEELSSTRKEQLLGAIFYTLYIYKDSNTEFCKKTILELEKVLQSIQHEENKYNFVFTCTKTAYKFVTKTAYKFIVINDKENQYLCTIIRAV